jgi:hypothetical protein
VGEASGMSARDLVAGLGVATHLQCAVDGQWETAITVNSALDGLSIEDLDAWTGRAENMALEIFLKDRKGNIGFIGTRWYDESNEILNDRIGATQFVLESFGNANPIEKILPAFEDALATPLFAAHAAYLELGVSNLWRSVGPCTVWTPDMPYPAAAQVRAQLARDAPHLLRTQPNPLVLEVAFPTPREHWLGVAVSRTSHAGYDLDDGLLTRALNRMRYAARH